MSLIQVLSESTINQIAAGEVVERPSAVIKELIENSMDAGATAITAEIKDGGLSLIRITDNGAGVSKEDIPLAFLRHATSKIKTAEDLLSVTSLGFRGEALSSIAAVAQVELITKTPNSLNGYRYIIEGGEEKSFDEIGCPSGTTIVVRNIFYNTPARRKFLKSAVSEASYVSDLMERLMVSHPGVSIKFIMNNQVKLQSSGNNNSKDILYNVYGRDISKELVSVDYHSEEVSISGFIGKPIINRGNRNFENYFINGRYIKSNLITKAIEEAYKPYMMQHKYPFTSLYYTIDPSLLDVNVHPQKLEVRLKTGEAIYQLTVNLIRDSLAGKEMIPGVTFNKQEEMKIKELGLPEPFEENRWKQLEALRIMSEEPKLGNIQANTPQKEGIANINSIKNFGKQNEGFIDGEDILRETAKYVSTNAEGAVKQEDTQQQLNIFADNESTDTSQFLSRSALEGHHIIGQVFSTYWLVEFGKELYIIDQHAAHEKVLYERIMSAAKEKTYESQLLLPPMVLTLTLREQEVLQRYEEMLVRIGYEFEHFGGNEYSVRAVPADLYGISEKNLIIEFLDDLSEDYSGGLSNPISVLERTASLSCKAAVKANHSFSHEEATSLIKELLTLQNPYHCPHGRPVIIMMSKYELEKKFKRIL
ncbi:MAG TPA: DNA mismatch repair endonuclease MutL [Mobilitalea sp.]|nr:DNA mismatch repair endonuclease MutL [Mobilitalea sp.]